jgi:lipoprotein-releasing system permease protein
MNGRLAFLLALRYVRGKKSANAVPILSRISMFAIMVGSAAMIILFSVFNGFEVVVRDLYKAFYPDLRITPVSGKFFAPVKELYPSLLALPGITAVAPVIEDNVLLDTEEGEVVIATLKGIDNRYFAVNEVQPYITNGRDSLTPGILPTAILGMQIAGRIGLDVNNDFSRLNVHYLNSKLANLTLNPTQAERTLILKPDGIFRVQDEFDSKYILAPIALTQDLFGEEEKVSAIEIKLTPGSDAEVIRENVRRLTGKSMLVETRFEQNHTLYQVLRTEKWATYAILVFVLLIASVNMIGALSLLVLEKGKDMAILSAMGATPITIRMVFLLEGLIWSGIGGLIGIIIGGAICWGQQKFGWIELDGAFVIKAYPVNLLATDFLIVLATVVGVGLLAAWYPAFRATRTGDTAAQTIYARLR